MALNKVMDALAGGVAAIEAPFRLQIIMMAATTNTENLIAQSVNASVSTIAERHDSTSVVTHGIDTHG